jgi:hypothetical protein
MYSFEIWSEHLDWKRWQRVVAVTFHVLYGSLRFQPTIFGGSTPKILIESRERETIDFLRLYFVKRCGEIAVTAIRREGVRRVG